MRSAIAWVLLFLMVLHPGTLAAAPPQATVREMAVMIPIGDPVEIKMAGKRWWNSTLKGKLLGVTERGVTVAEEGGSKRDLGFDEIRSLKSTKKAHFATRALAFVGVVGAIFVAWLVWFSIADS